MISKSIEDYWSHCLRVDDFPREIGVKSVTSEPWTNRHKVLNIPSLVAFLKINDGQKHCYMTLFSSAQKALHMYDTVLFDIDASSFKAASIVARKVIDSVRKCVSETFPRIYFSGKKGYHIYYDIPPTYLPSYSIAVQKFAQHCGILQYVDPHLLTDSCVCRIPYTVHKGTQLRMIQIRLKDIGNKDAILTKSLSGEAETYQTFPSEKLAKKLQQLSAETNADSAKQFNANLNDDPVPACVIFARDKVLEATAQHFDRVLMTMYMLNTGASKKAIIALFKATPDYVAKRSNYNVEYQIKKQVKIYGCRTIMLNGACPYDNETRCMCSWYPNIYDNLEHLGCLNREAIVDSRIKKETQKV